MIDLLTEATVFNASSHLNSILAQCEEKVLFCRIDDARSHDQVSAISLFSVEQKCIEKKLDQALLAEKYKIPRSINFVTKEYEIDKFSINISSGDINCIKRLSGNKWRVSNLYILEQSGGSLLCSSLEHEGVNWKLDGYKGNEFQGTIGDEIYFWDSNYNHLKVHNVNNGEQTRSVFFSNYRHATERVKGQFEFSNDLSYSNSFIADILISNKYIAWVNNDGELRVRCRDDREYEILLLDDFTFPCCLTDKYIMLLQVNEESNIGSLSTIYLGDL